MPRRTDRPAMLADAAIVLLAEKGVHGLTHRAVDAAAGCPAGTASNHFRTRRELLTAAAHRLLDQHLTALDHALTIPAGGGREALVRALVALVEAADVSTRTRYLAACELMLEATRTPGLAEVMRQVRAASVRHAAALLRAAGVPVVAAQLDWFASLLTGLTLERITRTAPAGDVAAILDIALHAATQTSALET